LKAVEIEKAVRHSIPTQLDLMGQSAAMATGRSLSPPPVVGTGIGKPIPFMDYALPRAADLAFFATALSEVRSKTHPLGFRGGGEGRVTPALGVIVNAIVDALDDLGVAHLAMPATAERVWRAIQTAQLRGLRGIPSAIRPGRLRDWPRTLHQCPQTNRSCPAPP
jgi:hypothetical protein